MQSRRFDLYDVLGVPRSAAGAEIKIAFRALAQKHHPDKNGNSAQSTALFQTIQNAYSVLCDPATRMAYDSSLPSANPVNANTPGSGRRGSTAAVLRGVDADQTVSFVLSHLNFILWDIEELLHSSDTPTARPGELPVRSYLLMMLTFIDKWVLDAAGLPDYFFRARRMRPTENLGGTPFLPYLNLAGLHRPYSDAEDYFYDVRRRADRLLSRVKLLDLFAGIPGTPLRVIDGLFEAHNYCSHYLGWLKRRAEKEGERIPPFRHSNPNFENKRG